MSKIPDFRTREQYLAWKAANRSQSSGAEISRAQLPAKGLVARSIPKSGLVCSDCGHLGSPKSHTKGSLGVEILLWIFFLIPGLIYSVWRLSTRARVCGACGSPNVIPVTSPKGRELVQQFHA